LHSVRHLVDVKAEPRDRKTFICISPLTDNPALVSKICCDLAECCMSDVSFVCAGKGIFFLLYLQPHSTIFSFPKPQLLHTTVIKMHFLNFVIVIVVSALAASVVAIPLSENVNHVIHERRDGVPKAWIKRDKLDRVTKVSVRVGMTQQNLDRGYDLLMEVYVTLS